MSNPGGHGGPFFWTFVASAIRLIAATTLVCTSVLGVLQLFGRLFSVKQFPSTAEALPGNNILPLYRRCCL